MSCERDSVELRQSLNDEQLGELYARKFSEALECLFKQERIAAWWPTEKWSLDDLQAVDFWVIREEDERPIPFQVTSTSRASRIAKKGIRKLGLKIPVIHIVATKGGHRGEIRPPRSIKNEIMWALDSYDAYEGEFPPFNFP